MQHFFGHPESPLFGVYHAPRGKQAADGCAVLVCPPIGQEYIRTHWCLRLMANQIARGGAHVLRFDYHGIGDSAGRIGHVDALEVWETNIGQAIDQLKTLSGAQTVMLIGQRFGGTLAGSVAMQRSDVNSVVLWEPITDGGGYLDLLRTMHTEMLDLWVCRMETRNDDQGEEILGSMYCRELINEIEEIKLSVGQIPQPQLIVQQTDSTTDWRHCEPSLQKILVDDRESSWNDLREIESAWLRPIITREIVKHVREMFIRLGRFGVLNSIALESQA